QRLCVLEGPTSCGPSCAPCTQAPAHATPACSHGACGFVCDAGFALCSTGTACCSQTAVGLAGALVVPTTVATKAAGPFALLAPPTAARLGASDLCPGATLGATPTPYVYVGVTNPTNKTARVSIWSSKATTAGAPNMDTILATYTGAAPPGTDAERK